MKIYVKDVETGVRVRPRGRSLRGLSQAWIDCMSKYEKRVSDDWPFWYGERPLIGFLTAATWASGSVCIEEYLTEKKADAAERVRETYLGRGDLYIAHGTSEGGWEGNVEFKMHDIAISKTDRFAKFLKSKWKVSVADAKSWQAEKEMRSFGGMFLRPYVGSDPDIGVYKGNLKRLLELAWDAVEPDVLAWWCPVKRVMEMETDEPSKKNWVVGAILLMKQVK